MSGLETRNSRRDSLLMMADVQLENDERAYRVQIRNLSSHGMMGVGSVDVVRGTKLTIDFRDAGKATGVVAWREGNRFGIAFEGKINPADVRKALEPKKGDEFETPRFVRSIKTHGLDPQRVRKV